MDQLIIADRSFKSRLMVGTGKFASNEAMVAAMIKLARAMEFRVVAEQVERQEDFDWLREVGVDFVQGYFVDRPVNLGSMTTGTYRALNP